MSLLNAHESTRELPTGAKTFVSAGTAMLWRIMLMPLDTLKSMLQVEGSQGMSKLQAKLRHGGIPVLYHGASGLLTSAFLGHYFWYGTYNFVDGHLPKYPERISQRTLVRNAAVGFCASAVSDTLTNSVRVLKAFLQTSPTPISYAEAVRVIVATDGVRGLFTRGLATRLMSNGLQAALFSATWKYLEAKYFAPPSSRSQRQ